MSLQHSLQTEQTLTPVSYTHLDVYKRQDYNMDASKIKDLVSDFSATSEEFVASISNITEAIEGITSASNDSAAGTTNIARCV